MEKDNVGQSNARTEQGKERKGTVGSEKRGSTVAGKFKDINALLSAYEALEAEFTRRSQRLKSLERMLVEQEQRAEKPEEKVGAEKPLSESKTGKNATTEEVAVPVGPLAGDGKKETAQEVGRQSEKHGTDDKENGEAREDDAESLLSNGATADESFVEQNGDLRVEKLSEEEIYQKAVENEGVRLRIVGEYLASLAQAGAPLIRGGRGTVATPPKKAKSVSQAGTMALQYFRDGK